MLLSAKPTLAFIWQTAVCPESAIDEEVATSGWSDWVYGGQGRHCIANLSNSVNSQINDAHRKADETLSQQMSGLMGGMGIPGMR